MKKAGNTQNHDEILYSILNDIITTRSVSDLLKIIFKKLSKVIDFDDLGLFHVLEDSRHRDFVIDANLSVGSASKIFDRNIRGWLEPEASMNAVLAKPYILSLEDFFSEFPNHPHLPFLREGGLQQFISKPLLKDGKAFGVFMLWSKKKDKYSEKDIPLFSKITEMISVALSNVLDREELLAEKQFKETLLAISEAVASIQDRKELFKVIFEKINPVIPIDDVGILILDESGTQWKDWAVSDNYHDTDSNNILYKTGFIDFRPLDSLTSLSIKESRILTITEFKENHKDNPFVEIMANVGLQEFMITPLTVGNKTIGSIFFDAKKEGVYNSGQFPLFKAIADQLAVAVNNVLATEKILEREQEKATLLGITSAVSKIRNLPDFLTFVMRKLKPIFNFYDVGVFLLTNDGTHHYDIGSVATDINQANSLDFFSTSDIVLIEHKDSLIEWIMEEIEKAKAPVLFDFVDLVEKYPNYYQFVLADFIEAGYRDCLVANLKVGDEILGMFCINALEKDCFKKEQFSSFQNVTEQLSVAVSNILANEQMEEEKKFSENLLEITGALAAAEDAIQLYAAINTVIKKLIPFDQVGVLILDKSEEYHYELINEIFVNQISQKTYKNTSLDKQKLYEHQGTSVEWLANNGPVITTMDFLVKNTYHPRHPDMIKAGVKELLGGPLVDQGKLIGMLAFKVKNENVFNEKHIKLFKSVSEQVSICVANVLSKKEILWKSSVQDLELKLSNILTGERQSNEKWGNIFQEFKVLIPFTFAIVFKVTKGTINKFVFEWITPVEKRQLSTENLIEITKLSDVEIAKAEKGLVKFLNKERSVSQPGIIPASVKVLMDALGLKSLLPHKMNLKNKHTEVYFGMFSKELEQYTIRHFNILKGVKNTLRISLENMFSSFSIKEMSAQLQLEKNYLESVVKETYNFEHMIGESEAMLNVFNQISEVAGVDATTLILGETGTGKELIARAIHENSNRSDRVLVKVNCAAIPSQIVESELFGHEKGSFTGAFQQRIGKFELANKGTIFLDEVGEMPIALQTKLLRVIQEREVVRLGSNEVIKLDIRIIAATNRNLTKEIDTGIFRADLFYRLNGYPIQVPPLRARDADVLLLADFFARQFSERYGLSFKGFTRNTQARFGKYEWPGNVRELQNIIEQAVISQKNSILEIHPDQSNSAGFEWSEKATSGQSVLPELPENFDMTDIKKQKDALEKEYLLQVLEKTKWRVSGKNGAARILDVAPSTLESRMKKLGIDRG